MNQSDKFNTSSPIDGSILNIIGFYLILCFILCVVLNSILLLIFIRYKELRIPLNFFIITISICNLFGSLQFPFVIDSNFNHKYILSSKKFIIFSYLYFLIKDGQVHILDAF